MKQIINTITNFLSNKINLTILQCVLYGILGYILKDYTWTQFIIVFIILLGIQFITHVRAVAQGLMMHQMMVEDRHQLIEFLRDVEDDEDDTDLPN